MPSLSLGLGNHTALLDLPAALVMHARSSTESCCAQHAWFNANRKQHMIDGLTVAGFIRCRTARTAAPRFVAKSAGDVVEKCIKILYRRCLPFRSLNCLRIVSSRLLPPVPIDHRAMGFNRRKMEDQHRDAAE